MQRTRSTQPSFESSTTCVYPAISGCLTKTIPAPSVSKATPTPSIDMSIRKQKGSEKLTSISFVETKAQLFSAAEPRW